MKISGIFLVLLFSVLALSGAVPVPTKFGRSILRNPEVVEDVIRNIYDGAVNEASETGYPEVSAIDDALDDGPVDDDGVIADTYTFIQAPLKCPPNTKPDRSGKCRPVS